MRKADGEVGHHHSITITTPILLVYHNHRHTRVALHPSSIALCRKDRCSGSRGSVLIGRGSGVVVAGGGLGPPWPEAGGPGHAVGDGTRCQGPEVGHHIPVSRDGGRSGRIAAAGAAALGSGVEAAAVPLFRLSSGLKLSLLPANSCTVGVSRVSEGAMSLLIELHHRFSAKLKPKAEDLRGRQRVLPAPTGLIPSC